MSYEISSPRASRAKLIAGLVLFVFVFSTFSGFFYTVEQGHVGLHRRFQALVRVEQPGFGFKLPFIEDVISMSVRTEKILFPPVESYSKDIQAAHLQLSLNYHVDPAKASEVYTTLGLAYADRIIVPVTLRITKEVFGQFNAQNIITERAVLGQKIEENIAAALAPHGIIVESFQMEDVAFSDAFDERIEARMQAEVEVARLRQNLEREKVLADIQRTQAAGKADALRAQAQAEADAITMRGLAEAKAIQARAEALKSNPDMIRLIQAERWNGVLPQTMVPEGTLPMLDVR